MGRLARALIVFLLVVAPATAAFAKSYWLSEADIDIVVNSDGSLSITERITFDFSGDFSGAYRDIPLGPGEIIERITVSDESVAYQPGACTELGCSSPAGSYALSGLAPGSYELQIHRTGYKANDAYSAYIEMGAPEELSPAQLRELQRLTRDLPETRRTISVPRDGTTQITLNMSSNDVGLVTLVPR